MRSFGFIVLIFVICLGCSGGNHVEPEALDGYWKLTKGYKDGDESTLLRHLYFSFREGQLTTNLMQNESPLNYTLDGNTVQVSDQRSTRYVISELTDSLMIMETTIRKHDFSFVLRRADENKD